MESETNTLSNDNPLIEMSFVEWGLNCGERMDTVDPLQRKQYREPPNRDERLCFYAKLNLHCRSERRLAGIEINAIKKSRESRKLSHLTSHRMSDFLIQLFSFGAINASQKVHNE
jgi:hypothetical protein